MASSSDSTDQTSTSKTVEFTVQVNKDVAFTLQINSNNKTIYL